MSAWRSIWPTMKLSIGDFVLSGGELAAAMVIDAVARLLPGVLGNEESSLNESFSEAVKVYWIARSTPDRRNSAAGKCRTYLLGGNHEEIKRWRRAASREKTKRCRPDLASEPRDEN